MKKIVLSFLVIIYAISAFITFKEIDTDDYGRLSFRNYEEVKVSNWGREMTLEAKLKQIQEYAKAQGINIIKKEYDQEKYYCAIGDAEEFCKRFNIDLEYGKELLSGRLWSISNKELNDIELLVEIEAFYNNSSIVYTAFEEEKESVLGTYYVSGGAETFAKDMGFTVADAKSSALSSAELLSRSVLIIFVIILSFTYLLYSIQRQKEVALCRMLGWKKRDIVIGIFLKQELKINFFAMLVTYIISMIATIIYNGGVGIISLSKAIIIKDCMVCIAVLAISYVMFYGCSGTKPIMVIKNKRPDKFINILCYTVKLVMILIISIVALSVSNNMKTYNENKKSMDMIQDLEDKYVYSVDAIYGVSADLETLCRLGRGFRSLYIDLEKKSVGCWNDVAHNEVLFVNEDYLNECSVILADGTIYKHNNNPNMVLLIPEELGSEKERIKESFENWMRNQAEIEKMFEDMEGVSNRLICENVDIEIQIIEDNQKGFLYHIDGESYSNNVIAVFNENIVSRDFFVSVLTTQSLFVNKEEVLLDMKIYGLEGVITGTERISDRYTNYLDAIRLFNRMQTASIIVLLCTMVLAVYFICENYLEQNKLLLAIENIHGYTLWDKHKYFIMCNVVIYYIILMLMYMFNKTIVGMLRLNNIRNIYVGLGAVVIFVMAIDMIVTICIINRVGNRKNKEILKGV